MMHR
jgi:hypothetical protein